MLTIIFYYWFDFVFTALGSQVSVNNFPVKSQNRMGHFETINIIIIIVNFIEQEF